MATTRDEDLLPTEGLPARPVSADAGEARLAPGTRLGRYRIDGLLARGGMGEVAGVEPARHRRAFRTSRWSTSRAAR